MKRIYTAVLLMTFLTLIALPKQLFAAGDTLVVYAQGPALDAVIGGDTTSTGAQAHGVYKLVSLDTTYVFDKQITIKSDITVIGMSNSEGRVPCIQPDVLGDGSIPAVLFALTGEGTKANFSNLYLLGTSIDNTPALNTLGTAIQVSADNIKLTTDNVVFENWLAFAIGYNGNWDSFFITNCKFRNMVDPTQYYEGEVLRNEWPGAAYTDSIVMRNNTMLCVNGYASCPVTKYYERYFEFSHNDVIYTFKNPLFVFNVTDAKINDNIFYAAWGGGISKAEYPWWDQLWSPEVGSIIDLDSLNTDNAKIFDPADSNDTNIRWLAEAKRTVEVKNNVYFWPSKLTDYWTAWNDTAHVDSIYTTSWMNNRTMGIFSDKTHWPGMVESGNINVDPGFGQGVLDVLDNTSGPYGIGFLNYFKAIRTGTASTDIWGYKITNVDFSSGNWIPDWPLPESSDMQYSNASLKTGATDGGYIGDPNWFTGIVGVKEVSNATPNKFALYEAYPNPFNPSTTIRFSVPQSGNVTLKVYNITGQEVMTVLDNEFKANGSYDVKLDMNKFSSGVYFYTLRQNSNFLTKKMILLK